MPQYNIFQAIFMSFYSKNLYRDVAQNWGGRAFLYLLVILAISWIPYTAAIQIALNTLYQANADKIVTQVPVITIKEGKVSTPENRPYLITDPDTHENIVVIDTTGQYTTPQQAKASVLVTQTQIISQPKANETSIRDIPSTTNLVVDPVVVNGYVAYYLNYIWIGVFLGAVLFSYIGRVIQALIYAIIGKIISAIGDVPLSYWQVANIMMVAITPVIVLTMILDFSPISISHPGIVSFLVAIAYLCFGIFANKKA